MLPDKELSITEICDSSQKNFSREVTALRQTGSGAQIDPTPTLHFGFMWQNAVPIGVIRSHGTPLKQKARKILRQLTLRLFPGATVGLHPAAGPVDPRIRPGLKGLRALITGGSSGIGEAIARSLLESEAKVVIMGRSEETVTQALRRLGGTGDEGAAGLWGDLTCHDTLTAVLDKAWERFDGIDALVNSIGTYSEQDPCEISREEWQRCLDTNLTVPFFTSTRIARKMLDRNIRGTIVNIGSCVGIKPAPFAVHYGLAKAALTHMTRSLAKEWGSRGIRVNSVSPGITMTRMTAHLERDPSQRRQAANSTALKRLATPPEIAAAVLFLISPQSSYVTGSDIVVDGGFVLS